MSLENLKSRLFLSLNELFTLAAVDELAGDMDGYREKLDTIAQVFEVMGIEVEITTVTLNLNSSDSDDG